MGLIDTAKLGKDAIAELHQMNKTLKRIADALEQENTKIELRRKYIEEQLAGSKYGIAYADESVMYKDPRDDY